MNPIVIDIGNSDLVFGYWNDLDIYPISLRISTKQIINNFNVLDLFLKNISEKPDLPSASKVIISSVVPALTDSVKRAILQRFQPIPVLLFDKTMFKYLPLEILQPDEIGTDLVANALAAHIEFHTWSIIIDFGTALSFTTINPQGKILGVTIAPGLKTALKALTSNAAQLFDVQIQQPISALGQNTEQAIQAGITYGYDGLVRSIIQYQEKELGHKLNVICTGGLSHIILSLKDRIDHFKDYHTLEGLRLVGAYVPADK